jgi:hypothetical protein
MLREKDRSRLLKDKKGHLKFWLSFKGHILKKDAAPPLNSESCGEAIFKAPVCIVSHVA